MARRIYQHWVTLAVISGLGCASSSSESGHAHPHEHPHSAPASEPASQAAALERADEPRLKNIQKLTAGGENAEAYWSVDGSELIFQSKRGKLACDQIFKMKADGTEVKQVSVGEGRTTCGYFQTDGSIVYASTHGHGAGCLASPDHSQGYVWPLYPEMDIWSAQADGSQPKKLFASKGYDAEATICHRDGRIVFTSDHEGDLELYVMNADGSDVKRMTNTPGYDGGAFFSPDCQYIVWRASRPEGAALTEYQALLAKHLVRPSALEIFVMKADGTDVRQITKNGAANFAPYMHPSNAAVIFASNVGDPRGRNFDLYMVNLNTEKMERVTRNPTFDSFPMFTHDGKKLVFASNRNNAKKGETNIFVADWVGGLD